MTPLEPPPLSMLDKYLGQEMLAAYTAAVTGGEAEHGRASGNVRSDDGNLDIALRLPGALGGPGGGTNPEQLFAAGYAACFHGILSLLAAKANLCIAGAAVNVAVTFARDPVDSLYLLAATVEIHLPGLARATAEELIRNAERVCPYSKMARQGITSVVALAP